MMDIHDQYKLTKFCWDNGVTIYPVLERGYWYIQANNKGRKTTYRGKELLRGQILRMTPQIQERIFNCYRHWVEKIKS